MSDCFSATAGGGRKIEIHRYTDPPFPCTDTPIHRPRGAPGAIGAGLPRYTDTPIQGGPGSDRGRIAVIHRYTDAPTPAAQYLQDPKPRIRHGDPRNTLPSPRTLPSPCRYADQRDTNCGHANEAAAKQVPRCGYTDRPPSLKQKRPSCFWACFGASFTPNPSYPRH